MHGQFPDITAGEEKRADHVGIGGEGQAASRSLDDKSGGVIHRVKQGIGECGCNHPLDQVVGGFATAAMTEGDLLIAQVEFMTASLLGALDLLQYVINALCIAGYRRIHKTSLQ